MYNRIVRAVIPARNEELYLPGVLDTACSLGWLNQIIIVDDCSTDRTLEIARDYAHQYSRLSVIHLDSRTGKSRAMLAGVTALQDRVEDVIFMDADLIGLKPSHIEEMYNPLGSYQCEMAVVVFRSGGIRTTAAQIATPNLSGQRCLRRSAAYRALMLLENSGYGIEIGLTLYALRNNWKVVYVPWRGVTHVVQESKHGLIRGVSARAIMYAQVIATWVEFRKDKQWLHPITRPRVDLDDRLL
jgi:glycosyltransferase involved in cell wall biosynthesis